MPRLENWSAIDNRLIGHVFDDPRFSDGDLIFTTKIKTIDVVGGIATTQNTTYTLGSENKTDYAPNGTIALKQEK